MTSGQCDMVGCGDFMVVMLCAVVALGERSCKPIAASGLNVCMKDFVSSSDYGCVVSLEKEVCTQCSL